MDVNGVVYIMVNSNLVVYVLYENFEIVISVVLLYLNDEEFKLN